MDVLWHYLKLNPSEYLWWGTWAWCVLQASLSGAPESRENPESRGFQLTVWTPLVPKREFKAKREAEILNQFGGILSGAVWRKVIIIIINLNLARTGSLHSFWQCSEGGNFLVASPIISPFRNPGFCTAPKADTQKAPWKNATGAFLAWLGTWEQGDGELDRVPDMLCRQKCKQLDKHLNFCVFIWTELELSATSEFA